MHPIIFDSVDVPSSSVWKQRIYGFARLSAFTQLNYFVNFIFEIPDEAILRGHIMDYNIKLSTIVMPEVTTKASYLPFYDHISGAMNGRSHTVHHDGNIMDFYVSLNEAFADILHSEAMYPTEIPELGK